MKAIRFTALACVLACLAVTSVSATGEPDSADQQLRKKVASLIRNVDLTPMEYHEQDATIKFLITAGNEIVVLSVHTASDFIEELVKERLNYNHVRVHGVRKMTPYTLAVRFVKQS